MVTLLRILAMKKCIIINPLPFVCFFYSFSSHIYVITICKAMRIKLKPMIFLCIYTINIEVQGVYF